MHYLVPFAMLFGYLSMRVRHGSDFDVVMPVVLVVLSAWSLVSVLRSRTVGARGSVVVALLLGVVALVMFGQFRVVSYDALGPQVLGAPLALAVVWVSLVFGMGAAALRLRQSWWMALVYVALMTAAWSLVVNPAMFDLGLFSYHAIGIYYGIPFAHTAFWGVSVAVGVAAVWWSTGRKEAALPLHAIIGPLLVLSYATGVCVAAGAWVPAVIGLVLSQMGLRAMYYL